MTSLRLAETLRATPPFWLSLLAGLPITLCMVITVSDLESVLFI